MLAMIPCNIYSISCDCQQVNKTIKKTICLLELYIKALSYDSYKFIIKAPLSMCIMENVFVTA